MLAQAENYMENNRANNFVNNKNVQVFNKEFSTYNVTKGTWIEVFNYVADKPQYFFASVTCSNEDADINSAQEVCIKKSSKPIAIDGSAKKTWSRANASACGELEIGDKIQIYILSNENANPSMTYNMLVIDK